ncbi:MAG TPA: EAL domain-containing protein, partial [Polyangiales bacterium]
MLSSRARPLAGELVIEPVFQPIVDLLAGEPIGCELLSRVRGGLTAPTDLFKDARACGELWEFERNCRRAAFECIARLEPAERPALCFVNVSPDVFEDERFEDGLLARELAEFGLLPTSVVVEITETHGITDHARFEHVMTSHQHQGFRFAVDDFGSGHSSLIT